MHQPALIAHQQQSARRGAAASGPGVQGLPRLLAIAWNASTGVGMSGRRQETVFLRAKNLGAQGKYVDNARVDNALVNNAPAGNAPVHKSRQANVPHPASV